MELARVRIVGIGDSTTAGTPGFLSPVEAPPDGAGNPESQYAFWIRRAHPDWQVANCGVNGEDSGEILARFPRDVLAVRPAYVIVLAGVNDIYRGEAVGSVESNLLEMYARAREADIGVVTATVLSFNLMTSRHADAIAQLNRWVREVSTASGFAFCDTHALTADPRNTNRLASSPDGLHPDCGRLSPDGRGPFEHDRECLVRSPPLGLPEALGSGDSGLRMGTRCAATMTVRSWPRWTPSGVLLLAFVLVVSPIAISDASGLRNASTRSLPLERSQGGAGLPRSDSPGFPSVERPSSGGPSVEQTLVLFNNTLVSENFLAGAGTDRTAPPTTAARRRSSSPATPRAMSASSATPRTRLSPPCRYRTHRQVVCMTAPRVWSSSRRATGPT